MPKKPGTLYYLYDDGIFDYTNLYEPTSYNAMIGYHAVAWNTGFQWTGQWQGRNVIGMSTNDPLYHIGSDISQAVQIQEVHHTYEQMPWLWEANQGVYDKLTMKCDVAVPVSWGTNLQQANFLQRWEDVSATQAGTDHGQRLWIQPIIFDNRNPNRPIEIYKDPYTNFEDIVVNLPIKPGTYGKYFDFSQSTSIQSKAFNDLRDFEVTQARHQFSDLIILVEKTLGIDLQNEAGYWSLIQEGITAEMATFPASNPMYGIGDHGAMQMAMMNLEVFDA